MSHAHPAQSVSSAFRLQIGCSSSGKDVPARLRCPDHIRVAFDATCYDLDDGNGGASGAVSTPWVGCVDLRAHYASALDAQSALQSHSHSAPPPPPRYPGYQVPAHGLLQLVVANAHHALRVFLVPYDLAALEPGGRMLVRERGYQAVSPASPTAQGPSPRRSEADRRASFGSAASVAGETKREVLRFAVEMQFACVLEEAEGRKPRTAAAGEDSTRRRERSTRNGPGRDGRETPTHHLGPPPPRVKPSKPKLVRAYYLTKAVRMVFPSLCEPQTPLASTGPPGGRPGAVPGGAAAAPSGRCTPTPRLEAPIRTERFVEAINPSSEGVDIGHDSQRRHGRDKPRKSSFAAETWEGLRAEWRRRLLEDAGGAEVLDERGAGAADGREAEQTRGMARDSASPEQRRTGQTAAYSVPTQHSSRQSFQSERIPIQPRPVQAPSLLSARLGSLTRGGPNSSSFGRSLTPIPASEDVSVATTRATSPRPAPARDLYAGLDADGVPLPVRQQEAHRLDGRGADAEAARLQLLSEQLEQLSSPTRGEYEGSAERHHARE